MGTILIIEDDRDVRENIAEVLREEGFNAATAANGLEALRYLRSSAPPCLIILDLMMPVMDGWQFREEQRRDPRLSAIPVVVISGDGHLPERVEALDVVDYLVKPFRLQRLLEMAERYCEQG